MNLFPNFAKALTYDDFLARYANDAQKVRWQQVHGNACLQPDGSWQVAN